MTKIRWHEGTASHMQIKENKGVTWLTYPAFEQFTDIVHGFSTRLGGVSEGIYASMNLSFTRGDEDAAVHENYRRFAAALGFSEKDIVTSDQTHTANVRIVTDEDRGNGITKPRPYTDVDGMITNVRGLVLATFYADCVPLYFVDPVIMRLACLIPDGGGLLQKSVQLRLGKCRKHMARIQKMFMRLSGRLSARSVTKSVKM